MKLSGKNMPSVFGIEANTYGVHLGLGSNKNQNTFVILLVGFIPVFIPLG